MRWFELSDVSRDHSSRHTCVIWPVLFQVTAQLGIADHCRAKNKTKQKTTIGKRAVLIFAKGKL